MMNPSQTNPLILVASLLPGFEPAPRDGVQTVRTALACLNLATRSRLDLILVHGAVNNASDRATLIELVDCLRHHPASRETPLLITLDRWHRAVLAELQEAGLELVNVRGPGQGLDPLELYHQATRYGLGFDIRHALSRLCPHLNCAMFDGGTELVTCGACHNRMVLGGERLRSVCQVSAYRHCAYFKELH